MPREQPCCGFQTGPDVPGCLATPLHASLEAVCFYSVIARCPRASPRRTNASFETHTIHCIPTGSHRSDRGIFHHLETRTACALICPPLPSGIYACFFYFSNHRAPASLKLIESETCPPQETLTHSIKEIPDFILSIRSKELACVFNTDTFRGRTLEPEASLIRAAPTLCQPGGNTATLLL